MLKIKFTIFSVVALLSVSSAWGNVNARKKTVESVVPDSLTLCLLAGDSCMQQFNTFEALKYYQQAYQIAEAQNIVRFSMEDSDVHSKYVPEDKIPREVRLKLADCYYKRADYRQTSELLKNVSEDSLSHDAFRQLVLSYKKQGDLDSYVYWASQLVQRYPMDGEIVAGLTLGYVQLEQPQNGLECGLKYFAVDSTNIEVNRALADAFFTDRQFDKASLMYERLLQQGDSTFNTLYSAGMSYTRIDSLNRAYKCLLPAFYLSQMQHAGCAYRLGIVCNDLHSYDEGLGYLDIATELMKPDTTIMRAITLSQGEAYYLTKQYDKAVEAWKRHLDYNPGSIATYYNIANAYYYFLSDFKQAKAYLEKFLQVARKEEKPTPQLRDMIEKSETFIKRIKI